MINTGINKTRKTTKLGDLLIKTVAATVLAAALLMSVGSVPAPDVNTRRGVEIGQHLVRHAQGVGKVNKAVSSTLKVKRLLRQSPWSKG